MLRIFHGTNYDFIRPWRIALWLTVAFIVTGMLSFFQRPIDYSIEFTGGTLMQVEFVKAPTASDIRAALDAGGVRSAEIQQFGTPRVYTVRARSEKRPGQETGAVAEQVAGALKQKFGAGTFRVARTEAMSPKVGAELRRGAIIALLLSLVVTMVYLAFRFEWRFGVAAVLATLHDLLTTIAFVKLMHLEVSLTVIAALLTVIGYSLNDTIIIFDRIRENLRKQRKESLYETLNRSINQTLPRTVLTHATTLAATISLLIFAGEVIRPFAWVMTFGIFTGTFSSIYIAGSMLLWIERRYPRTVGDGARTRSANAAATPRARTSTQSDGPVTTSPR